MKAEYNLANMKSRPNPYAKKLKQQLTLPLDIDDRGEPLKQLEYAEAYGAFQSRGGVKPTNFPIDFITASVSTADK